MNPAVLLKADPIAAMITVAMMMLAAAKVPERMGFGPEAATAVGGIALALAGVCRALWRRFKLHESVDWRDVFGAAIGVVALALGLEGTAVDQLDANEIVLVGSAVASAFAVHRATEKLPDAPTGALLLFVFLVLTACDSRAVRRNGSCAEFANAGGAYGLGDSWLVRYESCRQEVASGHDVCMQRSVTGDCEAAVPGKQEMPAR